MRAIRRIRDDDLRDALEAIALVEISDDELAERGLRLDQHDDLLDGLGPSHSTLIELATGEQYLLHRIDLAPLEAQGVHVHTTLTGDVVRFTDRLMLALGLPDGRLRWRISPADWQSMVDRYEANGRDAWLKRTGRTEE